MYSLRRSTDLALLMARDGNSARLRGQEALCPNAAATHLLLEARVGELDPTFQ